MTALGTLSDLALRAQVQLPHRVYPHSRAVPTYCDASYLAPLFRQLAREEPRQSTSASRFSQAS